MSSTTLFLVVAALLLTDLVATPGDAYPFRFPIPARFRGRGGWLRGRYAPPATATATTTAPAQCTCAPPSAPAAATRAGGARSAAAAAANVPEPDSIDIDCVTPVAGMGYCGEYLTGISSDAPVAGSDCCKGLAGFFDGATAAGGGGDHQLRCICPVIRGEVNRLMVKPVDPLRMIFLPFACGVAVPAQVIPLCLNASSLFETTPMP